MFFIKIVNICRHLKFMFVSVPVQADSVHSVLYIANKMLINSNLLN